MRLEMLEGSISGAMLNPLYAKRLGRRSFVSSLAAKSMSTRILLGGIATRAWAKSHRASLVGFICAHLMAMDWILNAGNKNAAIELSKMGRREKQAKEEYHKTLGPTRLARQGGSRHGNPPNRARSSSENGDHAISRACPG